MASTRYTNTLKISLAEKNKKVEKLMALCLKQREEIKSLKDSMSLQLCELQQENSRFSFSLEEKIIEVEKLMDLCSEQREEIKLLKDSTSLQLKELQQAKELIPSLEKQVASLNVQLQSLADDDVAERTTIIHLAGNRSPHGNKTNLSQVKKKVDGELGGLELNSPKGANGILGHIVFQRRRNRKVPSKSEVLPMGYGKTASLGKIFIKNLDKAIDNKSLHAMFSCFGNILSCNIATGPNGQSKGYGFVQFDTEEAAQTAIDKLNGMFIKDKQVFVGHFVRKQERDGAITKTKFNNVFVKNLSESTTDDDLKAVFGKYGAITSAVVMRDAGGKSRCFGFVNFENADDAVKAVESLNEKKVQGKVWYVGKAQKKSEREQLRNRVEQRKEDRRATLQAKFSQKQQPMPMPGVGGGMLSVPYDIVSATPVKQRTMLGEKLYPLVHQLEHEHAAKVTGMLLDMDQTEVLHLLESPDELKSKVSEAMNLLRNVQQLVP